MRVGSGVPYVAHVRGGKKRRKTRRYYVSPWVGMRFKRTRVFSDNGVVVSCF